MNIPLTWKNVFNNVKVAKAPWRFPVCWVYSEECRIKVQHNVILTASEQHDKLSEMIIQWHPDASGNGLNSKRCLVRKSNNICYNKAHLTRIIIMLSAQCCWQPIPLSFHADSFPTVTVTSDPSVSGFMLAVLIWHCNISHLLILKNVNLRRQRAALTLNLIRAMCVR